MRESARALTIKRRVAGLSIAVAIMVAASGVYAGNANARIISTSAGISCSPGEVNAYPPSAAATVGDHAWANLYTLAALYRWSGRGWTYVETSGWWATGATNQTGHLGAVLGQYWVKTSSGFGAVFTPFIVARGYYYAVVTYIDDSSDGTLSWVVNRVDASDARSPVYCLA